MNAKQFIQQQAEILEAAGNKVTVTETDTTISVISKEQAPFGDMIGLSAHKSSYTNRWNLHRATLYRIFGGDVTATTYNDIRKMVRIYGGGWKTEVAS